MRRSVAHPFAFVAKDVNLRRRLTRSARRLYRRKRGDMTTLRRSLNFWMPCLTTILMTCFNSASAQVSYKVTDLGVLHNTDNLGCAMSVNDEGWAFIMSGALPLG